MGFENDVNQNRTVLPQTTREKLEVSGNKHSTSLFDQINLEESPNRNQETPEDSASPKI